MANAFQFPSRTSNLSLIRQDPPTAAAEAARAEPARAATPEPGALSAARELSSRFAAYEESLEKLKRINEEMRLRLAEGRQG
ncbi:hypothetical protein GGD81_001293 [Rhodobium orientis]|uniref:Uncharacterized protein n=1 Tax=Rhodobium orientis TaxID=34017 RepID=A0A327JVM3_9HYPH|nr:hypothetical protein [Rhodobium orientis]MBB4302266.1 hypothetical protein [Rhodobium orientis]MBK5948976.1 hypothetical protein [Rhodobium orientis]RAI28972.1 hypothetical protein CH339_04610 [Rhodobium orientis]